MWGKVQRILQGLGPGLYGPLHEVAVEFDVFCRRFAGRGHSQTLTAPVVQALYVWGDEGVFLVF